MTARFMRPGEILDAFEIFIDQPTLMEEERELALIHYAKSDQPDDVFILAGGYKLVNISSWELHGPNLTLMALFNRHLDHELRLSLVLLRQSAQSRKLEGRVVAQSPYVPLRLVPSLGSQSRLALELFADDQKLQHDRLFAALWAAGRLVEEEGL